MAYKKFPIVTDTSCLLKWAWSTVFLSLGRTSSCHRCDHDVVTADTFGTFHNTERKIQSRQLMREGIWPQAGCQYCEKIENAGGVSDRMHQFNKGDDQYYTPQELVDNPLLDSVTPTILDIYFTNTCNMACLYCGPHFSTVWETENRKHGAFHKGPVNLYTTDSRMVNNYDEMLSKFWEWMEKNYLGLRSMQILGGEPFFQDELIQTLEFFETHSNPDLSINIISNLKVPFSKLTNVIERFQELVNQKKIQQIHVSASLDCWGPQQEFVRWGLDLEEFTKNMEYLARSNVILGVNGAISALTIKTMPDYLDMLGYWSSIRPASIPKEPLHYSFMSVTDPHYMNPDIFPTGTFEEDFKKILQKMPGKYENVRTNNYNHMLGIAKQIESTPARPEQIQGLKVYLDEMTRRRGVDWKPLFPWLAEIST
jgi:MoaA/NifB/PqqE/SkfB family radical SAM enzyme